MILGNFIFMAVCFATVLGTVTGLLALASASLGNELGGTSSGTLYICYTLSALLTAAGLVQNFGSKAILSVGVFSYGIYVGGFLLASEVPDVAWVAAIAASAVGGIAAGWVWTAQGDFLSKSSKAYAKVTGTEIKKCNSFFGGLFATIFVGLEVVFKTLSSLIQIWSGTTLVYVVYACCAGIAAVLMCFVRAAPEIEDTDNQLEKPLVERDEDENLWLKKVKVASALWVNSRKMKFLTFLNMAFGFTVSFINFYVNGTIVKNSIGAENIGWMAAIIPGVATILSGPYAYISNSIGKQPFMIFGAINYTAVAFIVLALSEETLKDLGWGISFIYVIAGSGRAVFESTNKATFADFFPNDAPGAFANLMFQSGGTSAVAFFLFPYLNKFTMALITGGTGILAIFGLLCAFSAHRRGQH